MAGAYRRAGAEQKVRAAVLQEKGITEQSFYIWRKRLRRQEPARFALVETGVACQHAPKTGLELVLVSGERLRIGAEVDPALLRRVVEALRR